MRNTLNAPLSDQLLEYGNVWMQNGAVVARGGKVKENILKHFGIKQELFYAELNTTLLFNSASPKFVFQEVPKFPEVRRDLSLVLDKRVTFDDIKSLANQTEKQLLQEITLFDVYQGDKIPADKKAYALGFTLLDEQKTLTDQDIDKTMDRLMRAFEQTLGAVIRR
jgi:phenylalanyl-tRNA synthetase beta chain